MARYDDILATADDVLTQALGDDDVAGRAGGNTATLTLIFDLTSNEQEGDSKTIEMDMATVTVARSELLKLGSSTPQRDMAILPSMYDTLDGWFAWTGDIIDDTPTYCVLKFSRPRLYRLGKR